MDEELTAAAMDTAIAKVLADALSGVTGNARTTTGSMKDWAAMMKAFSELERREAREPFTIREEEELGNDWLVF